MPDETSSQTLHGSTGSRDFLPDARRDARAEQPRPQPWPGLSKAECMLWAIALHRAAVAARLSGGAKE
jgi:hypothetical protein